MRHMIMPLCTGNRANANYERIDQFHKFQNAPVYIPQCSIQNRNVHIMTSENLRDIVASHNGGQLATRSSHDISHYNGVIMGAMASQITSITIVYSAVYLDADHRKHQNSASLAFVTGEFPAQRASNAEIVSIWWRHHAYNTDFSYLEW